MLSNLLGSLTFKDYLKGALGDSEVKKIVSELSGDALGSLSKAVVDAPSKLSSFGIGIGLTFLGQYLLAKKRGSPAARAIARIFGADVNANNRDFALAKLKEPGYLVNIRENILDVLKTKSIDDFAKTLGLSPGEAWEVYRQIKDVILDNEIIKNIAEVSNITSEHYDALSRDIKNIGKNLDVQIEQIASKIEKTFGDTLNELSLSLSDFQLVTSLTKFEDGDTRCWLRGYFRDRDIKSGYDARRPITDEIINSIEENPGTMLFGDASSGKSMILTRIMFEEIENGYAVILAKSIEAKEKSITELLHEVSKKFPMLLVIADNVHSHGAGELFGTFNNFSGNNSKNPVRFLFAPREAQFHSNRNKLPSSINRAIDYALNDMKEIKITFKIDDAKLLLKKALSVHRSIEESLEDDYYGEEAGILYRYSKGDPLMFSFAVRHYLINQREDSINLLTSDFKEKIGYLDKGNEFWSALLSLLIYGYVWYKD